MKTSLVVVTLLIAVFVLWLQLLLCVTVWNLAENVSTINHNMKYKPPQIKVATKQRKKA